VKLQAAVIEGAQGLREEREAVGVARVEGAQGLREEREAVGVARVEGAQGLREEREAVGVAENSGLLILPQLIDNAADSLLAAAYPE
jgi:hypothetical protein